MRVVNKSWKMLAISLIFHEWNLFLRTVLWLSSANCFSVIYILQATKSVLRRYIWSLAFMFRSPAESKHLYTPGISLSCRDAPASPSTAVSLRLPLGEDGEVREDREDRRGLLRRRLQVQEQRHGTDRGHQEVCGIGGRSRHQKDRSEGDQDAQGNDAASKSWNFKEISDTSFYKDY